ncbi:MAG TPA: hypothetical protein VFO07_05270 [Roseiflexaceae bacterium]|nr:hypothetical protein [Roseiflexaceae bacterium]
MWLVYLRFDDGGQVQTYHIRTSNKPTVADLIGRAERHGLTPTAKLVEHAHRRHQVERFHQDAKELLGWDQYQGRLWQGFHRHAALVMLSYSLLVWHEWQLRQQQGRSRGRPRGRFSPSAGSPPLLIGSDPPPSV